jgi:hypothetical protein
MVPTDKSPERDYPGFRFTCPPRHRLPRAARESNWRSLLSITLKINALC